MKKLENGIIIANDEIQNNIFSMTLKLPIISKNTLAGQFLQIYLPKGEMILPRPISICNVDKNKGLINIVYQVLGSGTKVLCNLDVGHSLRVLGPLGNGFMYNKNFKKVALVGGGIGTPPLLQLLKELKIKNTDIEIDVYLGFKKSSILVEDFKKLGANIFLATDSGEEGVKGTVVDLIRNKSLRYDEIFSCGPKIMLKNLSVYAHTKEIPCQVSIEERMACGIGACVGCVVEVKDESSFNYKKVCKNGPVFYSREVVWHG